MILSKYANNTFILKEVTQKIDLNFLNLLIIEFLNRRKELEDGASVNRAYRHLNYIIIGGYASLTNDRLKQFIETFLSECNIKFENGILPVDEIENIKSVLPIISIRKKDQHGGVTKDTPTIDPFVKPLSDVLNTYPGIKTFSSCEGHSTGGNEANFYVLFTSERMQDLDVLSKALWNSLELVMKKYDISSPQLMFDYGDWPSITSSYFEIRLQYPIVNQQNIFEAMGYFAELLIRN